MIKALILDLDDTIFPTKSIDTNLFIPFFNTLEKVNDVLSEKELEQAKLALWKKPFNMVAREFEFSKQMINKSLATLNRLDFELSIQPYDDYEYLQAIKLDKYLVTTGIEKLQLAKIKSLGLSHDFKEIFIDDPTLSDGGKLKIFNYILKNHSYLPEEILVIGDNPLSEIEAGLKLGMNTLLINRNQPKSILKEGEITSFKEVAKRIN